WSQVRRILIVRLRSIGDTVLSTPSLIALRRFLPEAQIDILLEDWVAPVLEGFDAINNVIVVKKDDYKSSLQTARKIRQTNYDVAYNLHGGTTGTFFVRASGAKYRVGYENYRYNFLYNLPQPSSAIFWGRGTVHSAEQQLALLGFTGVPVLDQPKSRLAVTDAARISIEEKLESRIPNSKFQIALLHPASVFETKQWATENFARVAEFLSGKGLISVAVAAPNESEVLGKLKQAARVPVHAFADLSLPEITALAARARVFVGNDSGIAHIAAAVQTPSVVAFGSSNINHWRPWTDAPNEIVYEKMRCQPCAGYFCKEFDEPRCILSISPKSVIEAIERVLFGRN
ncbi:MAG: glycosyltransferase family 9 protein, partial [Pyrinomonadaceae bacterium]